MKEQTYIVFIETKDGQVLDFFRFAYKKAETCKKPFIKALTDIKRDFWLTMWAGGEYITCYATPDGYHETEIVWRMDFNLNEVEF